MYRRRSRAPARKRSYRRYASLSDPTARREYLRQRAMGTIGRGTDNSINTFGSTWSAANDEQKRQRLMTGFRGRGDYYSDRLKPFLQKWVPKGTLSAAGGGIGGYLAGAAGRGFGSTVGDAASKYLGWGDYSNSRSSVSTNQIIQGGSPPITVNTSDDLSGDVYFSHREFVGNVSAAIPATGSSTFNVVAYPLNPGLSTTFPWLSQIAQNWTMYEFEGLLFEYKPTSGEGAGPTNALGKVVMATNYDPSAPVFTNSPQMESYDYSNAVKPSDGLIHGVETKNSQQFGNMQYVRTGTTTRDKIFTDIGLFQIATEGISGTASTNITVGELWVTYRIKLSRANLYGSLLAYNQLVDQHYFSASLANMCGNTRQNQALLGDSGRYPLALSGNSSALRTGSNIGTVVESTNSTSFVLTFPVNIIDGIFELNLQQQSLTAATSITFTAVDLNLCQRLVVGSLQSLPALSDAGSQVSSYTVYFRVTAPGNTRAAVLVTISNAAANNTVGYLKVTAVNQLIV